jgi:uncharacterized protein (DUF697 family)/GTPase SAR1 family protein
LNDLFNGASQAYEAELKKIGRFNLAIFGEAGVGKSTLINALFGFDKAATGVGRPVTLGTEYHEHPSGLFGVYDSRGVEVGVEQDKIIEGFRRLTEYQRIKPLSDRIHVVWYCVQSDRRRFHEPHEKFIEQLAATGLPVMLVMTQTYINPHGVVDPVAVCFVDEILRFNLPIKPAQRVFLTMALADDFRGVSAHGLNDLLDATFAVAPQGVEDALTAAQKLDTKRKSAHARRIVTVTAATAGTVAAVPVPFAGAASLVSLQVIMMAKIAAIFGLEVGPGTLATITGAALSGGGITQVGKLISANLLELVPGANVAGAMINASVATSLTYAVGETWILVCGQFLKLGPDVVQALTAKEMRSMFRDARRRGSNDPKDTLPNSEC